MCLLLDLACGPPVPSLDSEFQKMFFTWSQKSAVCKFQPAILGLLTT